MCTAIASAISASLCGVLNTQRVFGFAASTMRAEAASEIGVIVDPTMTSTAFSEISLRVFLTASVVSDLSSRMMKLTFCPPTTGAPIISKVFFSGIPSEAAGPVADNVTPTLMSAPAGPASASTNAAPRPHLDIEVIAPPVVFFFRQRGCRLFLQRVANLAQQDNVLGWWRRRSRCFTAHAIDLLHHDEDD